MVVKIKQADPEVATEVLADSIVAISQGIKKLRMGRLNDRALLLLIQDAAPTIGKTSPKKHITQKEVKAVLDGIENLEKTFIRK